VCLGALLAMPHAALAQTNGGTPAPTLTDLKQRLEELERTTAAGIASLRREIATAEGTAPATAITAPAGQATQAAQADERKPETFARDGETVARVDNRPIDPALRGFIAIPGTPSRLKVDGYAKLDAIVDTKPAGNPDRFLPSTIPIGLTDTQQTASTNLHIRQTRINIDFRSPTELGSDFRTFAEIDFFGASGAVDPRLRHFYGQLANVLVGQTWSTFTDIDAIPDTLDDGSPPGVSKLRQAQVRYTKSLREGQSLALSAERPLTEARTAEDSGPYSPAPDFVVRYRFDAARGHLQAGSVLRSLGYHDAERNTTQLGLGFNAAGAFTAANTDVVSGSVTFGRGVGRYVDNLAGTNSDMDLNNGGTDVTALPAIGAFAGYTHFWPRRFRSTGAVGYSSIDTTDAQPTSAFVDSYYVVGNLLWNPLGSLNVGLEYLFGTHSVKSGDDAHSSRIQFAAKYDFFRKRPLPD
jgi:hypothetical protein